MRRKALVEPDRAGARSSPPRGRAAQRPAHDGRRRRHAQPARDRRAAAPRQRHAGRDGQRARGAQDAVQRASRASEVSAVIKNAGGDLRKRTEKTDADGRALFEGMAPGDEFHAEVTVDGELLKTETFTIPQAGGVRTMLIAALGTARAGERGAAAERPRRADAGANGVHAGRHGGRRRGRPRAAGGTLEVTPPRRERRARSPTSRCCWAWSTSQQDRRPPRQERRGRRGALRRPARAATETGYAAVLEWHGMRLGTGAVPDARERRARAPRSARSAAPRDPSVMTIGAGGARHRPDARGQPAVPRDVPAREPLRQDVRPGARAPSRSRCPRGSSAPRRRRASARSTCARTTAWRCTAPSLPKRAHRGHDRQERRPTRWCSVSCSPTTATRARSPSRCRTGSGTFTLDHRADSGADRHRAGDRRAPGARARRPQVLGHAGRRRSRRAASWSSR